MKSISKTTYFHEIRYATYKSGETTTTYYEIFQFTSMRQTGTFKIKESEMELALFFGFICYDGRFICLSIENYFNLFAFLVEWFKYTKITPSWWI